MIELLRGLTTNPRVVGLARGIAEAIAFILLYSVADFLVAMPDFTALAPVLIVVVRFAEGHVDAIDPVKQRQRQSPVGPA